MTYYDLLEEQYMQQVMEFYEFSNVNIEIKEGVVYVIIDAVVVELYPKMLETVVTHSERR